MEPSKVVGDVKVMVWCAIWGAHVIGPIFIDQNLNGQGYLEMLKEVVFSSVMNEDGRFPSYLLQDGAPPHYGAVVRQWLVGQFHGHWIDRRGSVDWPPRLPDLTPLDFYLWAHLMQLVYAEIIRNRYHLQLHTEEACNSFLRKSFASA